MPYLCVSWLRICDFWFWEFLQIDTKPVSNVLFKIIYPKFNCRVHRNLNQYSIWQVTKTLNSPFFNYYIVSTLYYPAIFFFSILLSYFGRWPQQKRAFLWKTWMEIQNIHYTLWARAVQEIVPNQWILDSLPGPMQVWYIWRIVINGIHRLGFILAIILSNL